MDALRLSVALAHANVGAFLRVIRQGESSQDDAVAYRMVNGGGLFQSFAKHPYDGLTTTRGGRAAGAYQFIPTTWGELQDAYPQFLPDFSPKSQDAGAVLLIERRGALDDIMAGRFESAIARLRPTWTSLPGAAENSGRYTMGDAFQVFKKYGGRAAPAGDTQPAAPIEYRDTPARPEDSGRIFNPEQDSPMPFPIIAAASLALPLVQSLIEAFSPLAKQKVAAELNRHTDDPAIGNQVAESVMAAIMKLTGKTDPVEAVVAVKTDPEVAKQAEALTLEELDKLAPLLEKIAAQDLKVWEAEDAGRDAAGARGRLDGENDIGRPILWAVVALCGGSLAFLFAIMGVQTVYSTSHEPSTSMLTLVGPLIGGLFTALGTLVAYRFGTTRNNSLKDITVEQLSRRK